MRIVPALLLLLSYVVASSGCSGGSTEPGNDGEGPEGCRFAAASCSDCIAEACGAEADACYGAGWKSVDLCSSDGASAMCHASSAAEGLARQSAYGKCVASSCTAACE
jgi:hypothetical protein